MVPTRVYFSPGFPAGAGFPGQHVFWEFSGALAVTRTMLEQLDFCRSLKAGFPREHFFTIF
jgi:hypothetical protein